MAAKKAAPQKDSPKKADGDAAQSKPTFKFVTKDGVTLSFPVDVRPDKQWLWEVRKRELTWLEQTFDWMDRAGVAEDVQAQAVSLSDQEYSELIEAWFAAMGGVSSGE